MGPEEIAEQLNLDIEFVEEVLASDEYASRSLEDA
jgi:hypothetical protein